MFTKTEMTVESTLWPNILSVNIDVLFISFNRVMEDATSNIARSTISNHNDTVSSIGLDDDPQCQFRLFDSSSGSILRNFPPPYSETCPLSASHFEEPYSCDQAVNDGVLYELDSQYLYQLLPMNSARSSNHTSITSEYTC